MTVWVLIITFAMFNLGRSNPAAAMSAIVVDNLASKADCERIAKVVRENNGAGVQSECVEVKKVRP